MSDAADFTPEPQPSIPEWTLGWRLKRALTHPDEPVSVQEMADHVEYSRSQVSRWLNDKPGEPPRRNVLIAWALRCGVSFEWLAHGKVPGPNGPGTSTEYPPGDSNPEPADSGRVLAFRSRRSNSHDSEPRPERVAPAA